MITKIEKVLLTGKTHTTISGGGGRLNLNLSSSRNSTKPDQAFSNVQPHPFAEQLFAGAWSACFMTALGIAAKEKNVTFPSDAALDIEVDMGTAGTAYFLQVRINVTMPGVERHLAETIAQAADEMCVYSKATRGNIDVVITVI